MLKGQRHHFGAQDVGLYIFDIVGLHTEVYTITKVYTCSCGKPNLLIHGTLNLNHYCTSHISNKL